MNPRSHRRHPALLQILEPRTLFSFVLSPTGTTISASAAAGSSQIVTTNPAHAQDSFTGGGFSQFQPAYTLNASANASYQLTPQQITIHNDASQTSTPVGSLWPDDSGASAGTSLYFNLTAPATISIHGALSSSGGGDASVSLESFRADSSNTTAFNQNLHLSAGAYILFVSVDASGNAGPADSADSADVTLNIADSSPPKITSPNAVTFHLGQPSRFIVTTSGDPTPTLKETAFLPAGITFTDNHDGTATLAGTPKLSDATGHYDLIFSAKNGVSLSPTQPAANQFFTLTLAGPIVRPIVPTHVVFTLQPLSTTAGPLGTIRFSLLDNAGRLATANNSLVTLTLNGAPAGTLHGPTTVHAVNGVATFPNLSITKAGTYTLTATAGSLPAVTSRPFTINPDPKTAHLVLTQSPGSTVPVGTPLPPFSATAEDHFSNIIKNSHTAVTLSVVSAPANGKVHGTTTLPLTNGTATFNNISFTQPGTYTLLLTNPSLPIGAVPIRLTIRVTTPTP